MELRTHDAQKTIGILPMRFVIGDHAAAEGGVSALVAVAARVRIRSGAIFGRCPDPRIWPIGNFSAEVPGSITSARRRAGVVACLQLT